MRMAEEVEKQAEQRSLQASGTVVAIGAVREPISMGAGARSPGPSTSSVSGKRGKVCLRVASANQHSWSVLDILEYGFVLQLYELKMRIRKHMPQSATKSATKPTMERRSGSMYSVPSASSSFSGGSRDGFFLHPGNRANGEDETASSNSEDRFENDSDEDGDCARGNRRAHGGQSCHQSCYSFIELCCFSSRCFYFRSRCSNPRMGSAQWRLSASCWRH